MLATTPFIGCLAAGPLPAQRSAFVVPEHLEDLLYDVVRVGGADGTLVKDHLAAGVCVANARRPLVAGDSVRWRACQRTEMCERVGRVREIFRVDRSDLPNIFADNHQQFVVRLLCKNVSVGLLFVKSRRERDGALTATMNSFMQYGLFT